MWDILYYLAIVLFLAVAMIASAFVARAYLNGIDPRQAVGALFAQKPERRLGVVESSNVDGRRRLILIRRDDVEHLIMTGGPVDMVIETGIGAPRQQAAAPPAAVASPPRASLRT
jgi:hypothetical protein